jgi:hypothetical protein
MGSWLFTKDSPIGLSVLASLSIEDYAFQELGFDYYVFEVKKRNKSVINYHKRPNSISEIINENAVNYYFKLSKASYDLRRNKFLKICTNI